MQHSVRYTLMFAAAVCVVCSIFVSGAAVGLKEKQEYNSELDRRKKVLDVAGLMSADNPLDPSQVDEIFQTRIKPLVVELETGKIAEGIEPADFDQKKARDNSETSEEAPANQAQIARIPNNGLVYQLVDGEELQGLIIPIEGKGLWSTLYGFLALDKDSKTIRGITFYQHAETPGLGGEVDNVRWKGLWPGRKAFDDQWQPKITVKKGTAGSVEDDPYQVDGLSGATITARGVTHLVQFWLGEHGFGPYLKAYRAEKGIQ